MTTADSLAQGRESFRRQAWADAYRHLAGADQEVPLGIEDLEQLAIAAYLIARDQESADLWARAHHECLGIGDVQRAARYAFWLAFELLNSGEMARAGGWLGRAQSLVESAPQDWPEEGYLLLPQGIRTLEGGDAAGALAIFGRAAAIGERFAEADLVAMGRLGRGRSLLGLGKTPEGIALLDEAMVAVTSRELSPIVVGIIYCAVIEACHEVYDLRRAREWTAAMSHWCGAQPDLVPYRGECLVRRAEIMQLRGAWQDASEEAERARERLLQAPGQPAVGSALYQQAELNRLRGDFGRAEKAYREASRWGRQPEPGLALLWLARGQVDAAVAALERALDEAQDQLTRSRLLGPVIEVMLVAGEVEAARLAADELSAIAAVLDAPLLHAISGHATGAVFLAEGDPRTALRALRQAWMGWQEMEAPYEAARVRVLIGLCCRALGDGDTAEMELDAARWVFQQLGAGPDLARAEALSGKTGAAAGGLSARELQVLRLIAAGKTNRAVAADLFISDKTVARHVSNIFTKLGLSSRAAATAYAYEHDLT
jgi:ATP/maltotriose-dependent transcriptional regulator MalT